MFKLVELLTVHGDVLLLGSTFLLLLGAMSNSLTRVPVHRQRLSELAVAATLVWIVLAWVPIPRVDLMGMWHNKQNDSFQVPPMQAMGAPAMPYVSPAESPLQAPGPHSDAPRPVSTSIQPVSWRETMAIVYMTGAGGCLLWLVVGQVALIRAGRSSTEPPPWIADLYESLLTLCKCQRAKLRVSSNCARPVVFGLFCPKIMLPAELCRRERQRQLRHVLLHELAHVKRGDAWGHLLFNLALPLLYFHPIYWWINGRVRFDRELIADDWAARFDSRRMYVEDLIDLVRKSPRLVPGSMGVLGIFQFRTHFFRRMEMLINRKESLSTAVSKKWRFALLLSVAIVLAATTWILGVQPAVAKSHSNQPSPAALAQIKSAEKALEANWAAFDNGTVGVESVYLWSRRLMESRIATISDHKQQREAILAHVKAMQKFHLPVEALWKIGARGGETEKMYATQYYLREAERIIEDFDAKNTD
ncbi:MAG: M56 family metallopeptidase [Pirellulales bacterium]|nr:M56 family metallopeptidase [Pirellulales bacterium]